MKRIASVKFGATGQMECFTSEDPFFNTGDQVLVDSGQGLYMGRVMCFHESPPEDVDAENIPAIVRVATPQDHDADAENRALLFKAKRFCDQRIRERKLDMKLVDVETLFDRSKLIFFFTAPTRIDFRELVKDLVREYHTRIELRQIGVRHETQMLGALGSCGMTCCCRRFLRKFMPVTIKMAKEQNLFLNPTKISGICGRLLCCLSYEQENYDIFHRSCPRLGKRYQTTKGPVKVLRANLFRNSVAVLTEQNEELEFTLEEWKELEPRRPDAPQAPADGRQERDQRPAHRSPDGMMVLEADPDTLDDLADLNYADDEVDAAIPAPRPAPKPAPKAAQNPARNTDGDSLEDAENPAGTELSESSSEDGIAEDASSEGDSGPTAGEDGSGRIPHRHKRKRKK